MAAVDGLASSPERLSDRSRARVDLIVLALMVVAGGAARFATLGHQSFDSGETVTAARILQPSYAATFAAYSTIERSGPLYYTLAWAWAHLFGSGEVALRSLAAIFGTATIPVLYLLARELFSRRAALIAALLAAASPDLFWYSQEARSYPLFVFFGAATLYFFVRASKRPTRGALGGWAACASLSLCTHYFSAFAVGPEAVWLVWRWRRQPRGPLVAAAAIGAIGFALLPLAIHQEGSGRRVNSFTSIPVLERAAASLVKFMTGEGPATSGVWSTLPLAFRVAGLLALAVAAASIAMLAIRGTRSERRGALLVGAVGLLALLLPLGLAFGGVDYVEPRNLLGSLVPLLVVFAGGIDVVLRTIAARRGTAAFAPLPAAAFACLFGALIAATYLNPSFERYNWRRVGELVAATPNAGVVLADPASAAKPLHYFLAHPVARLKASDYPCGVRTRTIVTITHHNPPRPGFDSPFRRISSHRTAQGWIVAAFRSRVAQPVDAAALRRLRMLGPLAGADVDAAAPVTPSWGAREVALDAFRGAWVHIPGPTTAGRGWPPRSCSLAPPHPRGSIAARLADMRADRRAA